MEATSVTPISFSTFETRRRLQRRLSRISRTYRKPWSGLHRPYCHDIIWISRYLAKKVKSRQITLHRSARRRQRRLPGFLPCGGFIMNADAVDRSKMSTSGMGLDKPLCWLKHINTTGNTARAGLHFATPNRTEFRRRMAHGQTRQRPNQRSASSNYYNNSYTFLFRSNNTLLHRRSAMNPKSKMSHDNCLG